MDYSARSAMAGFNRAAGVPRTHYAEAGKGSAQSVSSALRSCSRTCGAKEGTE